MHPSPIRAARVARGLRQEDLARLLKVTRQTVANWESGRTYPRREVAFRLVEALGITLEEVYR